MSCPTCSHTLHSVVPGVFWCPRCGTLTQPEHHEGGVSVPRLVERCRRYAELAHSGFGPREDLPKRWIALGIEEAIRKPEKP